MLLEFKKYLVTIFSALEIALSQSKDFRKQYCYHLFAFNTWDVLQMLLSELKYVHRIQWE